MLAAPAPRRLQAAMAWTRRRPGFLPAPAPRPKKPARAGPRRYEEAEPQRVNRWLAQSGVCSRREAEALIGEGLVYIDGERVEDAGRKILPGQTLTLTDKAEGRLEGFTAVLHKPTGVVSGQPEPGYTPAVRLLTRGRLVGES